MMIRSQQNLILKAWVFQVTIDTFTDLRKLWFELYFNCCVLNQTWISDRQNGLLMLHNFANLKIDTSGFEVSTKPDFESLYRGQFLCCIKQLLVFHYYDWFSLSNYLRGHSFIMSTIWMEGGGSEKFDRPLHPQEKPLQMSNMGGGGQKLLKNYWHNIWTSPYWIFYENSSNILEQFSKDFYLYFRLRLRS